MIKQLATVVYYVPDLSKEKQWLKQIFDITPYFDEPFYVGYDVGGYELGVLSGEKPASNHIVAYWRVDNLQQALSEYESRGAQMGDKMEDVGDGILVATIVDPFGNHFGIIENPHFKVPELIKE